MKVIKFKIPESYFTLLGKHVIPFNKCVIYQNINVGSNDKLKLNSNIYLNKPKILIFKYKSRIFKIFLFKIETCIYYALILNILNIFLICQKRLFW